MTLRAITAIWRVVALVGLMRHAVLAEAPSARALFELLDKAPLVVTGQVHVPDTPRDPRLLVYRIAVSTVLKADATAPDESVAVVQELLFPSDAPLLRDGQVGVFVLEPLPNYSWYRARLGDTRNYRWFDNAHAVIDPGRALAIQRWLALEGHPAAHRPRARVDCLVDLLEDSALAPEAIQQLAATASLDKLVGGTSLDRMVAYVGNSSVPLDHRRALLAVFESRHITAVAAKLRPLQADPVLGPFIRASLAELDGGVDVDRALADTKRRDAASRMAAVAALSGLAERAATHAGRAALANHLAGVARHDADDGVRLAAVDRLAALGNDAVPELGPLLGAPSRRLIYQASQALARIDSEAAVEPLAQQFTNGSYETQVCAVFALRQMTTERAAEVLAAIYADPPDPRLRKLIDLTIPKPHVHD